jgi:oligoendopeptidase F
MTGEKMKKSAKKHFGTKDVIWDLSHIYRPEEREKIDRELEQCLDEARKTAEKYRGRVAELSPPMLLELVSSIEGISMTLGRISAFSYLDFSVKIKEPEAGAFMQKIREFSSLVEKELLFFDIEWAKTPDERAEMILNDPVLEKYRHYLQAARRYRPYLLTEAEEQLLAELGPVGRSSWINLFEKTLAHADYGGNGTTQEEVLSRLYSPDRETRKAAADAMTSALKQEEHILAHTFNTVLGHKMITDRLRGYPRWDSSMNLANELDDSTVDALVDAVSSRYDIVARYYNLKKAVTGHEKLYDYDRYAPLPFMPEQEISWEECRHQVLESFRGFSSEMARIAERFFEEEWIHAPVQEGKTSGAYAHPVTPDVHPYVLVNYTGRLRDVETVAHELGHGVHQTLAARGGYFNSQTPLILAETASVFGEMLVFRDILSSINAHEERLCFLSAKIESIFATVFRQTAMNRFEKGIHTARREKGELSPEELGDIWMETQKAMFMDSVELREDYRLWWSYIGHFLHTPGYVYAYAFGELLVLSLHALYKSGLPDFTDKYMALLAAGGNGTPYELLEPFGIDLRDPGFWHTGLSYIDDMVTTAEGLFRKWREKQ